MSQEDCSGKNNQDGPNEDDTPLPESVPVAIVAPPTPQSPAPAPTPTPTPAAAPLPTPAAAPVPDPTPAPPRDPTPAPPRAPASLKKASREKKKAQKDNKLASQIHDELEDLEYYHGQLLEEEVKNILPRKGDFILRLMSNPKTGDREVHLTVNWNEEIINVKMRPKGAGKGISYGFDKNSRAKSMKDLMQKHLMGTELEVDEKGLKIHLLNPIAKQAWELRRESVDLIKKLGEGAFGEVHAGRLKLRLGKTTNVAIKVIKKSANNEKATTELMKEGSLMRKFNHPNVVKTFGMVIERDTIMVVMELISGGGLNDYVKTKKVSMEEKGNYALDIACGLAYIHSLNCIHRDIACRNCLIDMVKKQAKVSDFGLTRQTELYKIQPTERIPIRWIAPEVLKTFEYTRAADIYAYGILVWEIVSNGATPYDTQSNQQIKEGVQMDKRPEPPADTPAEIVETMKKCWSGDPTTRPQMTEVKKLLAKFKIVQMPSENEDGPAMAGSNGPPGRKKKKDDESAKRRTNTSNRKTSRSKDKGKSGRKT